MTKDKGLLAMDESNPTCNKRFAKPIIHINFLDYDLPTAAALQAGVARI